LDPLETFSDEEVERLKLYEDSNKYVFADHNLDPSGRPYKLVRDIPSERVRPTSRVRAKALAFVVSFFLLFVFIHFELPNREKIKEHGWDSQSAKCFVKYKELYKLEEVENPDVEDTFDLTVLQEGNHRCLALQILKEEGVTLADIGLESIPFQFFHKEAKESQITDYCVCKYLFLFFVVVFTYKLF